MASNLPSSLPIGHGVGIADSDYARDTRRLNKLMSDLRDLGASAKFELPCIAVIGNQSAGKSSLVEAISGITVPRASGTCTRCPMECRLQRSEDAWKCQISLRFETNERGSPETVLFGEPLSDKRQLEVALRRAQLAILNPGVTPSRFVDFDIASLAENELPLGSTRQLQFSSNVICLDLSGRDLVDLSFIDLPGIIHNVAEREDRENIDLVKNLVMKHISGEGCLILLTLTMRDELENQSAAHFAKLVDPEGVRTIGVFTKPDTIQRGEESGWLAELENRGRHRLTHGYYMTKQPSPTELDRGLTWEEGRTLEQTFFANTGPWNQCSGGTRSKIGVPNLTRNLSKLLSSLIMKMLPKLRFEAQERLTSAMKALAALPPSVSNNPLSELLKIVGNFQVELRRSVEGSSGYEELTRECGSHYKTFKHDIRKTAPNFRPFRSHREEPPVIIDRADVEPNPESATESDDSDGKDTSPVIYIDDVHDQIERCTTRELPFNVPYAAKIALIKAFFEHWEEPALTCFEAVCLPMRKCLSALQEKHFGQYTHSSLNEHVKSIIAHQLQKCREFTVRRIKQTLEMENRPFTVNNHYFASCRSQRIGQYKSERRHRLGGGSINKTCIQEAMYALQRGGISVTEANLIGKLIDSRWDTELELMADVRAYFQVTYKRIIDDIPRSIDQDFLIAVGNNIQDTLIDELKLGDENSMERARAYMAEDPLVAERRADYEEQIRSLQSIIERLFSSLI